LQKDYPINIAKGEGTAYKTFGEIVFRCAVAQAGHEDYNLFITQLSQHYPLLQVAVHDVQGNSLKIGQ
jgi:hypothetical protein